MIQAFGIYGGIFLGSGVALLVFMNLLLWTSASSVRRAVEAPVGSGPPTLGPTIASRQTLRSTCEELLTLGRQQLCLIEALFTLANSERGVVRWESFDLAAVTARLVVDRGDEATGGGIHVESALMTAPTAGDPSLVEILVANLVDNALRHNVNPGRLEISTATTDGRAVLSVGNTGPVIPRDDVERLFQPFQRLGDERIGPADGYGLGLAIVSAIARAHNASLMAHARPGGGLDVQVSFPLSASHL